MKGKLGLLLGVVCAVWGVVALPVYADRFELTAPVGSATLQFRDELIEVRFAFVREAGQYKRIGFTLVNLSGKAIAIDWNASSITFPSGEASNVMHEGTRFLSANDYIAPTTVPPASRVTDSVIPTSSVHYSSSSGWAVGSMYLYQGAEFGFYLSLSSGRESHGYDFRFRATEVAKIAELSPLTEAMGWLLLVGLLLGLGWLLGI